MRLPIRPAILHAPREVLHNFREPRWPTATTPRTALLGAVATGTLVAGLISPAEGSDQDLARLPGAVAAAAAAPADLDAKPVRSTAAAAGVSNGRIAYHAYPNGFPDVYTIRPDGSRKLRLTANGDIYDNGPAWAPGGQQLVFGRYVNNGNQLWLMNRNGTDKQKITHNGRNNVAPAWSPNGHRIVYACFDDNDFEICTIKRDGTGRHVLTDNTADDNRPEWSPTGGRIAFVSAADGDYEIYTMAIDGSDVQQFTHNTTDENEPTYSPSGARIAYNSFNGHNDHIFIKSASGGPRHRVTRGATPSWAPGGGWIAFVDVNGTSADIYRIRVKGTDRRRVTHTQKIWEDSPDWGARPGEPIAAPPLTRSQPMTDSQARSATPRTADTPDRTSESCRPHGRAFAVSSARALEGAWESCGPSSSS